MIYACTRTFMRKFTLHTMQISNQDLFGLKLLLHSESVPFLSLYCFLGGGGGSVSCRTPVWTTSHQSWPWVWPDIGFQRDLFWNPELTWKRYGWVPFKDLKTLVTTHHMLLCLTWHGYLPLNKTPCCWAQMTRLHINFLSKWLKAPPKKSCFGTKMF